ncbi:MAG TPA: flagellar protein FlaG [Syntrophorhabdaceae bacterium]|jgi:uncharacterized FlaG/YvyC family protein
MIVDTKNGISEFDITANSAPKIKEARKVAAAQDTAAEEVKISEELLKKIEETIKESGSREQVSMHYDRDIDKVVVTVSNAETGEVTRQIPSAEFVSFVKNFDQMLGLMINRRL